MPQFSHDVPIDPRGPSFLIVRTPPARPFSAVITSPNLVGCFTHYYKGRTVPCEGQGCQMCLAGETPTINQAGVTVHGVGDHEIECDGPPCEACHDGMPYRWHAYQSAYVLATSLHCLFECTAQAAEHFTDYRAAHNTLRGCEFEARRYNSRPNGRILLRCRPANLTGVVLPNPPDLIKCLAILWGFPAGHVKLGKINPDKKTQRVDHIPPGDPSP